VINKGHQHAADTLMSIIAQAKPLSTVRGLAFLALLKVLAVYMHRTNDAIITLTQECKTEIEAIFKLYPYMQSIYYAIISYIKFIRPECCRSDFDNKYIIQSMKSHKSHKVWLAIAEMLTTAGEHIRSGVLYYMQSAYCGNSAAMNAVVEHWIDYHYQGSLKGTCKCHFNDIGHHSTIMWFILILLADKDICVDSRFESVFIKLATMYVVPYIYEYKRIVGICGSHDAVPKYRGVDKVAHNLDLLAKQHTYMTNFKNTGVKYCDVCLCDDITCYTYACGIHAYCAGCTGRISNSSHLRRCPKCQIPEHPYFKDAWKIKRAASWQVAIANRCRNGNGEAQ
jgi:hypothetical protein